MKSITNLFRIGFGPSSSHTVAPTIAARSFLNRIKGKKGNHIEVTLHGSLALTGEGHGTRLAIASVLKNYPVHFHLNLNKDDPSLPNTFDLVFYRDDEVVEKCSYRSLGGGELYSKEDTSLNEKEIYPFSNLEEVKTFMKESDISSVKEFCLRYEEKGTEERMKEIARAMLDSVKKGLSEEGVLPANENKRLHWVRSAKRLYEKSLQIQDEQEKRTIALTSYAYAVSESNASLEEVVTAPTCGASGVLASVLYYAYNDLKIPFSKIVDSLYVAGLFGNVVKQNASISGAIGGCEAEVGTATSMAASALCFLFDLSFHQCEYAAECAMEHFLGLSCDSVDGYVIIPCIERNGVGALRAYDSYLYAKYVEPIRDNQVSFDNVVKAMKLTGDSLSSDIKETANGGLAKVLKKG